MKAWRENIEAVRRAWAEQDRALHEAHEKLDPRRKVDVAVSSLRRLAEHCSRALTRANPVTRTETVRRKGLRC